MKTNYMGLLRAIVIGFLSVSGRVLTPHYFPKLEALDSPTLKNIAKLNGTTTKPYILESP
ncbi:MAG TPA: hypothetical protein VK211_09030 [Kamptonema sp.]|nr:hypothetical protein [Kamptonema sp.]